MTSRALAEALLNLPRALSRRRLLPPSVEADIQLLEHSHAA